MAGPRQTPEYKADSGRERGRSFRLTAVLGIIIPAALLLALTGAASAKSFVDKRKAWLSKDGKNYQDKYPQIKSGDGWAPRYYVFAWLEKGTSGPCGADPFDCKDEVVESFINPPGGKSLCDNAGLPNLPGAARSLYQYGHRLSSGLRDKLKKKLAALVTSGSCWSFGPEDSQRTQPYITHVKFLAAQDDRKRTASYQGRYMGTKQATFTYKGKTYTYGQTHNVYETARDWIYRNFDYWVQNQVEEFDSPTYLWIGLNSLLLLYDFADRKLLDGTQDPEGATMKRRAKMMIDLYLLDAVLDFGGKQRGGILGRPKAYYITSRAEDNFPFYQYFDHQLTHGRSYGTDTNAVYISGYRVPGLILDIGHLADEPDGYWHINMEPRKQKMTYVTRYHALGSSREGSGWRLTIASEDGPAPKKGYPFALWINNEPYAQGGGEAVVLGESGIQYKNFMYVKKNPNCQSKSWGWSKPCPDFVLHIFREVPDYQFDEGEGLLKKDGGHYAFSIPSSPMFLREGKTMIGIKRELDHVFLEASVMGQDHKDLVAFKAAFSKNVKIAGDTVYTSKGTSFKYTDKGGQYTVKYPGGRVMFENHKRLEAFDHLGVQIVSWSGKVMTVKRHGKECKYDFGAWTYSGNGCQGSGQTGPADGGMSPEGGPAKDLAAPRIEGGPGPDKARTDRAGKDGPGPTSGDGSGCGCHAASWPGPSPVVWALLALLGLLARRRGVM